MERTDNTTPVQYSTRRVGLMIFAVFLCAIITGFGSYKLVPMQSAIQNYFGVAESAYGYLNTSASWISVICAVPMGFLVRKLPCNWSVLVGFLVAIGGIVIQVTSGSFVLFVIGRMIEGTGTAFVALVTGSLTLTLVPKKRLSFWAGVMIMAGVLPQVIMAKGGTMLMLKSGLTFQNIFLIIAGVYAAMLALWLVIMPFSLRVSGVSGSVKPTRERTMRVIRNRSGILVAVANICYAAVSITFTSYVIKYLTTKGIEQSRAADIYSYATLLGLASMIIFGILSDKLKTKRKIAIMSFFAAAVAFVLLAVLPANLIFIYIIVWGTLPRSIAGMTSASASDIAEDPMDIPIVNSVKQTITSVGSIVTGILMGYLIQYCGYEFTIFLLAGSMVVGAVCWIFAKRIP